MYQKLALAFTLLITLLCSLLVQKADATALTYSMAANEISCFYINADKPGKKIGFYFAVKERALYLTNTCELNHVFCIGTTRWFF